jgi:hypothetical protein
MFQNRAPALGPAVNILRAALRLAGTVGGVEQLVEGLAQGPLGCRSRGAGGRQQAGAYDIAFRAADR